MSSQPPCPCWLGWPVLLPALVLAPDTLPSPLAADWPQGWLSGSKENLASLENGTWCWLLYWDCWGGGTQHTERAQACSQRLQTLQLTGVEATLAAVGSALVTPCTAS